MLRRRRAHGQHIRGTLSDLAGRLLHVFAGDVRGHGEESRGQSMAFVRCQYLGCVRAWVRQWVDDRRT